ncbi:MAG: lytic transglycosylase domain-containing protein [Bacteroidetes bacterium]|nr:lytic transglycosylase domain-containing protein [Bacteroidota bacterium]MCB0845469.1 lytic transglycosylase domain-containing protein [Bacteroidota bacterium]
MISKLLYLLIGFAGIAIGNLSFNQSSEPQPAQDLKQLSQHLSVINFGPPANLEFGGQKVPLDRPEVKKRLERELSKNVKYHHSTLLTLKRMNRYRETFVNILEKKGVPADFFYMAVAESNLANATSPVGAQGFWQFMKPTARAYGLEVSTTVDERFHPEKATFAAARYLKDYYEQFGDWSLVAAAYNMGGPRLKRKMKVQPGKDYYGLDLNSETDNYMYRILGYKCILEQPMRYGLNFTEDELYNPIRYKVVSVNENISDLRTFAMENGSTYELMKLMNPWLIADHLAVKEGKTYYIRFPFTEELNASELLVKTIRESESLVEEEPTADSDAQLESEPNTESEDEPNTGGENPNSGGQRA